MTDTVAFVTTAPTSATARGARATCRARVPQCNGRAVLRRRVGTSSTTSAPALPVLPPPPSGSRAQRPHERATLRKQQRQLPYANALRTGDTRPAPHTRCAGVVRVRARLGTSSDAGDDNRAPRRVERDNEREIGRSGGWSGDDDGPRQHARARDADGDATNRSNAADDVVANAGANSGAEDATEAPNVPAAAADDDDDGRGNNRAPGNPGRSGGGGSTDGGSSAPPLDSYWIGLLGEAAFVPLALAISRANGIDLFAATDPSWTDAAAVRDGLLLTVPFSALYLSLDALPIRQLRELKRFTEATVMHTFGRRNALEVLAFAAAAGIGEEALFRGAVQTGIALRFDSTPLAMAASSALFGAVHAASVAYFALSASAGALFAWQFEHAGHNLWSPAVTHALYDFITVMAVKLSVAYSSIPSARDSAATDNSRARRTGWRQSSSRTGGSDVEDK